MLEDGAQIAGLIIIAGDVIMITLVVGYIVASFIERRFKHTPSPLEACRHECLEIFATKFVDSDGLTECFSKCARRAN